MNVFLFEMYICALFFVLFVINTSLSAIGIPYFLNRRRRMAAPYQLLVKLFFDVSQRRCFADNCRHIGLTKTEIMIVQFLYQGLSNREVADKIFTSEETVKSHVQHILRKADVKSRAALIFKLLNNEIDDR